MRIFGAFVVAFFLLVSCARNNQDNAIRYHDDGRAKPIVSFVPVLQQATFDFPWNVSDEFSTDIYNRLMKQDKLFLRNQSHFAKIKAEDIEPFGADISWMKASFEGSEYVIFMELVDHHVTPIFSKTDLSDDQKTAQSIDLTMRVRVVDLRDVKPKVILQEMIHQSHHIPKFLADIDYTKYRWGTKRFRISPIGISHRHFTKEISIRLEDYITLSQSY